MAAQQAADHERQLADSSAPRPGQQFEYAPVKAAHIGLPFLPNAVQDLQHSSRTSEPGYGTTVSTELRTSSRLEDALVYYRKQVQDRLPGFQVEEVHSPGYATLTASQPQTGARVTVLLHLPPTGGLTISLSRWEAGTAAAPAVDDNAGQ